MRKAIFITGGGSGIGRAAALLFAGRGWFVGLGDIDEAGMAETARQIGGDASCHRMDVRDREQWRRALGDFVAASGGRLDVLFNNAGVARGGPFVLQSEADHDLVLDVNLKGVIYGAEAAFPHLKATPNSCLLNTCSAAGIYAGPGLAMYAASKFGVRALTESLNGEWEEHGIRVRSLMPSYIDTPLLDVATAGSNLSARETVRSMGLEFTPVEQVAEAAWKAAHGKQVHTLVGKTARRLAFVTRWAPFLLTRMRPPRPAQPEG